jgi:D-ribose pyranase
LVNRHLSGALAELGHGDGATELVLGGATAARKVREANPEASALLDDHLPWPDLVPHEKLRPYANVLLRYGVFF